MEKEVGTKGLTIDGAQGLLFIVIIMVT